jgi:predicted metal-dependent peptidase
MTDVNNESHTAVERDVRASMARLRARSPFFGTLAMYARFVPNPEIETAATDGLDVFYNPAFFASLPSDHLDAVIVHEVLHAALDHVYRRGGRSPLRWNFAADVVVNGLIAGAGLRLPESALRSPALERYSVEEVYVAMEREGRDGSEESFVADLIEGGEPGNGDGQKPKAGASDRRAAASRHWAEAIERAAVVTRGRGKGELPANLERAFDLLDRPRLDWRTLLWRYLTRTPTDFATYDRRQIHRGLYIETLESQSVRVIVGVDTSGSIDATDLNSLVGEVRGLLGAYPQMEAWLIYCDAKAFGPYRLEPGGELPTPEGGGGTDFRPFFQMAADEDLVNEGTVAVYLTDGDGDFPADPPSYPVLWIVTPGGKENDHFPFGEVTRIGAS